MVVVVYSFTVHQAVLKKVESRVDVGKIYRINEEVDEAHFIHEIKTTGYDVISVNVFLPKLMKFLPKKLE